MLVVRGIAKICCWVSNCMLFFCLLGVFVEGVLEGVSEENRSTVIELIMFGVLIFFARLRLGHFLYQTEGKTYRYARGICAILPRVLHRPHYSHCDFLDCNCIRRFVCVL